METALIIFTTLFGGLNIFQFIFFRTERKKRNAEANLASVEVQEKDINLKQDQFDFILSKLSKYQSDYYELADMRMKESRKHMDQVKESDRKYSEVINGKCNEIADLKSKIIYLGGLRCYKSDCSHRELKKEEILNNNNHEKD